MKDVFRSTELEGPPGATPPTSAGVGSFNDLAQDEATRQLLVCCASMRWASQVAAGRPYASSEDLLQAAEAACRDLEAADVDEALAAHPRIGARATGASTEARWSRQEQASVAEAEHRTREQLQTGNAAYEQRFGRVFLIRAAGRTPEEMLTELLRRLGNDPESERREVADQLCQIARLRLERLLNL